MAIHDPAAGRGDGDGDGDGDGGSDASHASALSHSENSEFMLALSALQKMRENIGGHEALAEEKARAYALAFSMLDAALGDALRMLHLRAGDLLEDEEGGASPPANDDGPRYGRGDAAAGG